MNTKQNQKNLFKAIALLHNTQEAETLFTDLCTPAELRVMSDRLGLIDSIKQGVSYRKIYEKTGISVTTIGRVARCMQHGSGGYDLIYKRLKEKKRNDDTK